MSEGSLHPENDPVPFETRLGLDPAQSVAQELSTFGGLLRCETCRRTQMLGDLAGHLRSGWPKCCGYTMRWWTQRQIDGGEMPS